MKAQVIRLKPTHGSKARAERAARALRKADQALDEFLHGEPPEHHSSLLGAILVRASLRHGELKDRCTISLLGRCASPHGAEAIRQIKDIAKRNAQRVCGGEG